MLEPLRHQGNHGTIIDPHRSIATVRLTRVDVLLAAALAIAASVALIMNLGTIGKLWTWIYVRLAGPLGFAGGVGQRAFETPLAADFTVPYFNTSAPMPSESVWWVALVVTALVLLVSFVLPPSWLPFAYLLRLVVLVQSTALAFFRVAPSRFPYDLPQYMSAMLAAGMAVLLVIPVLLALTFYVIDVGMLRKILLTVVMLGHLLVFIPLQYAVHAWLVLHGTLLLLPVLFMLFGLLPEVMVLIGLYGWGMSWRAQRARTRRE
ncbi:MAG: hypothetical protein ABJE10_14675 [bacterium]